MSANIIDGRKTRDLLVPKLIGRIKALSYVPKLAIIQVGNRSDSTLFINSKKSFAKKIGITDVHTQVDEDVSEKELLEIIQRYNEDKSVNGIIVQLPLPENINLDLIIDSIDPKKDVDALTASKVKYWLEGRKDSIYPATARGVRTLLKEYKINLSGKKVTIIGRSMLVGKPLAMMCLSENATVSICHSGTLNLEEYTKSADIIIVATGKPDLVGAKHVKAGQIIIDVGINTIMGEKLDDEIATKKLIGDVDFEAVKDIVEAITPVPGGVGPMTVVSLFENLLDMCDNV